MTTTHTDKTQVVLSKSERCVSGHDLKGLLFGISPREEFVDATIGWPLAIVLIVSLSRNLRRRRSFGSMPMPEGIELVRLQS